MNILKRNKEKVRNVLYFLCTAFILYYIYDINSLCNQMSTYMVSDLAISSFNFNSNFQSNVIIDLNESIGGILWQISMNIINIIFLVMLMLIIYINECIERSKQWI